MNPVMSSIPTFLQALVLFLTYDRISRPVTLMRMIELPEDILLNIYSYITPQDLLALNQTCRTLHVLGTSSYAWNQLEIDLPLEADQKTYAGDYRPFDEIRHSLLDAFRVEAYWSGRCNQIRGLTRIDHGGILARVQLLRRDWLITLSRNQTTDTTYLSAWHLDGIAGPHCAAKVEVTGRPSRFAATVRNEGDSAIIALLNDYRISGEVDIFSLSLTDDYMFEDAPISPLKRVGEISFSDKLALGYDFLQDHRGMFVEVQVNNNIVAVSVIRVNRLGSTLTYQIVLADMDTLTAVVLSKTNAEDVTCSRFIFKLFPDYITMLFPGQSEGSLYLQSIRDAFKSCPSTRALTLGGARSTTFFIDRLPVFSIGSLRSVYCSEFFGMLHDISFTVEVVRKTQHIFGMISRRSEKLRVFRFVLRPATVRITSPQISVEHTSSFSLKNGLNVENLALGRMGYRLVLLERSWETDEYRLKKITLPMPGRRAKVVVHDLMPSHIALPFELHRCISIWFEEATGRVCFGLHTGEVYLLKV